MWQMGHSVTIVLERSEVVQLAAGSGQQVQVASDFSTTGHSHVQRASCRKIWNMRFAAADVARGHAGTNVLNCMHGLLHGIACPCCSLCAVDTLVMCGDVFFLLQPTFAALYFSMLLCGVV